MDKKGNTTGQGTLTFMLDGIKYVGEWKDGEYNGQGTLTYADGEQWKGEWQEDQRLNGLGTN